MDADTLAKLQRVRLDLELAKAEGDELKLELARASLDDLLDRIVEVETCQSISK